MDQDKGDCADDMLFLSGGGEMGALMRAHDWSTSPLGQPGDWPQSLRAVVSLMLNSRYPMFVAWGPELGFLYNDGYAPIFGAKHPHMLGRPFREAWTEIWDDISPLIDRALAGEATYNEDLHLVMERNGYPEDTWYSFSYSPVRDESGAIAGMFCACTETTQRVLSAEALRESEARLRALNDRLPGGIVYQIATDAEGQGRRFLYMSPRHEEFTGIPAEAVMQDASIGYELIHEDDRARLAQAELDSIAGKRSLDIEVRYRHINGDLRWCRIISDRRVQPDGTMVWDGIQIDISEQKQALEALRESDARFRFLDRLAEATQGEDDPEAVMAAATRLLGEYLGADICAYADVEADSDQFHIRRDWTKAGIPSIVGDYSLDDFGRVAATAQRSGKALVTNNAIAELGEEEAATFTRIGIAATICLPLVKQGRLAAMMAVHSAAPRTWAEAEISLVWEVAERCWAHVERVGANAVLRESERRFREQFENANDFIFTTDLDMRITSCNPAVANALERSPDELVGHRISEFTPPETWEHNKQMLADKLAGKGDATRYEVEVFDRRGERMIWEINSRLVRDVSGIPTGLHAIARDVSERIRHQRLIEEARIRAEAYAAEQAAILGQLAEGVIVTDAEGRITFVNEAATRLHGITALDVEPSQYSDTYRLFREDGSSYPFDELPLARAVMAGETVRDARWRIHRPNGSEVLAIGNAQPVLGPDGQAIGAVLTIRDDTARVAAEQALRELNETLEERVERRTAELEQAQEALRQSQKLEAMGQLTGGVAHDFNNLLSPILGSLDLLQRRGVGDEREQKMIDGALQSAERAKLLVQRLLAFARRQPLKTVPVGMKELIGGMAELVGSTCGPNIKVSVAVEDGIAPALADPNQLEMAILNLSVNARDAMPDGGRLTLSATSENLSGGGSDRLPAGHYVRISIADTGLGMDEATRARAIEPFFSTKGIGKGTGLGLSMAHGLASQLGGALTISSNPGLGTNVEIWLPASKAPVEAEAQASLMAASEAKAGTILLVDDEALVRMSTADMLTDLGYKVIEASNAEEALNRFETGRFDMLVTDHLMPGMSGVDLVHAVRHLQPEMPSLIVSGYAENDGIPHYLARLTKPFRQADLAAALDGLVRRDEPIR